MTDFVEVTSFDPLIMKAPKGDTGPANTLTIGTVQSGDTASATLTGTSPNQTLNLTLPKGDKGDTGAPGPAGSGDVSSVNNVSPDANGNVALTAADVGAVTTADLASKADLVGGTVPTSQIPAIAITDTETAASETAMLALTVQKGDICIRTDTSETWIVSGDDPTNITSWTKLSQAQAVQSVNGQTGVIVLAAADVDAVPTTRTVNSKALSANIVLNASDVSAVPTTRTVNSKALSADITLTAADVSALPDSTTIPSTASDVGAVANASGQTLTLWSGTAAQYAAIGTKDANTVYVVTA